MKKLHLTLFAIALALTSCTHDEITYDQEIEHVYFDPNQPGKLIVETSTSNKTREYEVDNSIDSGYHVTMTIEDDMTTFEFEADEHIEHLDLREYNASTGTYAPFKELGTGHFILKKPTSNFDEPANGYYKFIVDRYYRNY